MSLRLRADDGTMVAWTPAVARLELAGASPLTAERARAVAAAIRGSLTFLGYEAGAGLTVRTAPGPGLLVGPASAAAADYAARGYSQADFHYYCLKTHPRAPLAFGWDGLEAARRELGDLQASSRALAGVSLEPSSRGVTGYLHRFREALSRDFDFPEALSCVWDGLRPGALSPGSKAAFLRATLPALGLE